MCPTPGRPYGARMVAAAVLGILYVAAPGSVNVATLRQGIRGGFGFALAVQLGAFVGDLPYVVIGVLGCCGLTRGVARVPLAAVGTCVLVWMGWRSIREAGIAPEGPRASSVVAPPRRAFLEGAVISAANPLAVVFWTSLAGSAAGVRSGALTVLPAFLVGELACGVLTAAVVGVGHAVTGPLPRRIASIVCGIGLIGFGISTISGAIV